MILDARTIVDVRGFLRQDQRELLGTREVSESPHCDSCECEMPTRTVPNGYRLTHDWIADLPGTSEDKIIAIQKRFDDEYNQQAKDN